MVGMRFAAVLIVLVGCGGLVTESQVVSDAASADAPPADARVQGPSWIRIAYTVSDPPFDVCFPLIASLNAPPDFTGAKPAIGGGGIKTGTVTPYLAVPTNTNAMRFVAAHSIDCSTEVGVRLGDSIGPFAAQVSQHYTIHVDRSGYDYSTISVDGTSVDAGAD